jgi:hypothetical protein
MRLRRPNQAGSRRNAPKAWGSGAPDRYHPLATARRWDLARRGQPPALSGRGHRPRPPSRGIPRRRRNRIPRSPNSPTATLWHRSPRGYPGRPAPPHSAAAPRDQPAPEILEAVVGAIAMDHIARAKQIPGVACVQVAAESHLEGDDILQAERTELGPQGRNLSVRIVVDRRGALDDAPECVGWHRGRCHALSPGLLERACEECIAARCGRLQCESSRSAASIIQVLPRHGLAPARGGRHRGRSR